MPLRHLHLRLKTKINKIIGKVRVEAVEITKAGDETQRIACDGVLFTGKFTPEAGVIRQSDLALDPKTGGPVVDETYHCSDPAFHACGNALRPVETAGWWWHEGWRTGEEMAKHWDTVNPAPTRWGAAPPGTKRDRSPRDTPAGLGHSASPARNAT